MTKNPPNTWSARCQSPECTGFASVRCPECGRPTCAGCLREWTELEPNALPTKICGAC